MLELESPIADMIPFIVAKTYDVAQRGHVLDADRVRVRVEAAPTPQDGHAYKVTQFHCWPFCFHDPLPGREEVVQAGAFEDLLDIRADDSQVAILLLKA